MAARPTSAKAMNLGIEIGGTKLQLVLGDDTARIIERQRLTVNPESGASGIRKQIREGIGNLQRHGPIRAVGVGFGGPVNWETGKVCRSHQIEGWSEFDLSGWLQELVGGVPVRVDNDANLAALGEAKRGAGSQSNPVFYITLGSGVGGGLVVNGKVYHGATPGEAEIGHVRLDRDGTTVESRCSGWAVDARIRQAKTTEPGSILSKLASGVSAGEAKYLPEALAQGDPFAQRLLKETATDLAFGLSHVVHLFHPEIVVVGGGLAGIGEPLRAGVDQALKGFVMDAFAPGPRVSLAALGEDAVPVGALVLAASRG